MVLYKYKSLADSNSRKYALDSLEKKYLYFSRPSELNDPFDGQILIDYSATDGEYQKWIDDNKPHMLPDNKFSTVDGMKKELKAGNVKRYMQLFAKSFVVEQTHILSLTSNYKNEVMWGLYAGNYNGICIGYNVQEKENKYSFKCSDINISDINNPTNESSYNKSGMLEGEKITYDNNGNHKLQFFKDQKSQTDNITYNLSHKKKCWASEEEYRFLFFDYILKNRPPLINTKMLYSDDLLAEIIFGYKVSDDDIDKIMSLVNSNYSTQVKFYSLKPDLNHYSLRRYEST